MDALHERVHAQGEDLSGGRHQQRSVVAHTQQHVGPNGTELGKETVDEFELTHRPGYRRAPCSCGRSVRAARSSTPLTNLWPSVAP